MALDMSHSNSVKHDDSAKHSNSVKHDDSAKHSNIELPQEIPGFHEFGHIPLEHLHNTRDLGHLPTTDGRSIKPACLIRSGCLHHATTQDIATLVAVYRLEGVVDLRTKLERNKEPDPRAMMEGVVFYDFPALVEEAVGITHGNSLAQDMKVLETFNADPHDMVKQMYVVALTGAAGRQAYSSFLEVLLQGAGGAYLWHCTEGKDRAGLASVIVERALGVPEEYVRADYLATNLFVRTRGETIVDEISRQLSLLKGLDADIDSLFYAFGSYYDFAMQSVAEKYGTFECYMEQALDFGSEKQALLREKYLK